MTYQDSKGHEWEAQDPSDHQQCTRCGVYFYLAAEYDCRPAADAVQPAPARHEAPVPPAESDPEWAAIEKWLRSKFEDDLQRLYAKRAEYGSADLRVMGESMVNLLPGNRDLSPAQRRQAGLEMALGFYAMGKASRGYGAWERGQAPSADTWRDLSLYASMARYVRENGDWP